MITWQDIDNEIQQEITSSGPTGVDIVRRKKLKKLFDITHRPVLLYGVEMFNPHKINASQGDISIDLSDKDGFVEALKDISGNEIDIILHSPGGSPEATESLVKLLRRRFNSIRFIVPSVAKSAATMFTMSGDEIILGDDAELGPTDPQILINKVPNPAHAILKQFDLAKQEVTKDNTVLPAWLPILQQYGPSLLMICKNSIDLSTKLVTDWLITYMFGAERGKKKKAINVSKYLSGDKHLSHNRPIDILHLQDLGVNIKFASVCVPNLSEIIQEIHYSLMQTFLRTGAYKIYENHLGKGVYKTVQIVVVNSTPPLPPPQVTP